MANATYHSITGSEYVQQVSETVEQSTRWFAKKTSDTPRLPFHRSTPYERVTSSLLRRKRLVSVLTIGLASLSGYYYYQKCYLPRLSEDSTENKRRAKRMPNGARYEVVLIIGSPVEPLTRLIALDLEKRGFIVYITLTSEHEVKFVETNRYNDFDYLDMVGTPQDFELALMKFKQRMNERVVPFAGAQPHKLHLTSAIFIPDMAYPVGPVENISSGTWNRVTAKLNLYLNFLAFGLVDIVRASSGKIILVNPVILPALKLPFHSPETITFNAVQDLFTCLHRELSSGNDIQVTQIRLGNMLISNQPISSTKIDNSIQREMLAWDDQTREIYAENFTKVKHTSGPIQGVRGTPLRELYHLVYDLIYDQKRYVLGGVCYCGSGARIYDIIGGLLPHWMIDWWLR
ncbi:hypothetical protein BABINDRAFT_172742 [Babjeviella inositovora NRRL Y-12698]|uniref:DUF1776-domain-containing protein n=1 Tax=Babjeviella inositovora NRRL Y-12698 TaxID=984486 RepID=A0A1E3QKR6_9ASCO|nr:uncharacterized protein BABINDRAFT_172742 [Babjeviella inositovora NRRL Y-12698]ODQ77682.1 hypothetical protein BABINDRAFT_172742 [Babjeviella inositovora NRRL Y-12698]